MRTPLSLAALACGAVLLAAAGIGSAATTAPSQGGTLRVNVASDFDAIDPAVARTAASWQMLQATCARLVAYPDWGDARVARIVPEVATGFPTVSSDGRTYTFTLRRDHRFSDGRPVTPAAFAHAIARALNPKLASPAATYVRDVVGADAVLAGTAERPSGVTVSGDRLAVRLVRPASDFLARMASTFFCAVPPDLPSPPGGVQEPFASAGPYALAQWAPRRSALLRRNGFYRGPRTARIGEIAYTMGVNAAASLLQVERGEADLGPIPPASHGDLIGRYGLGTRYFVQPSLTIVYLALHNKRPLFRDVAARKAVNAAIDRPELVRQYGVLAGKRTDQIVPPGIPGWRDAALYPMRGARSDLARKLAPGLAGRKAILVAGNRGSSPAAAQIVQYNLRQIGLDVEIKLLDPAALPSFMGDASSEWDIGVAGWSVDVADPFAFLGVLFDGRRLGPTNNTNLAYFDEPEFNRSLDAAQRLQGDARSSAYAALDARLMGKWAPVAPYVVLNTRQFVSARVGCVRFVPLEGLSLSSLCLKG